MAITSQTTHFPFFSRDTALTNGFATVTTIPMKLIGYNIINLNTIPVYVKYYDKPAGGTAFASDIPSLTLQIPAATTIYLEPNFNSVQLEANTALTNVCVTGIADTDSTAPAIPIYVQSFYRQ